LWQTCIQLLEKDFKIDANGARAFKGFFLKKLFLCGVETVKRFVNVHLHCNVSNLKNISNMIRTVARKSSIGQGGLNVCAGGLGAYFGGESPPKLPRGDETEYDDVDPSPEKISADAHGYFHPFSKL